ncbi:AAA family ATPase [Candidatus Pelagibacter sp.]|nr:AAA family ATPase [Candidatus Pelagibacter sp.]
MIDLEPINQTKLFGFDKKISELFKLFDSGKYPNKLLLSGKKGSGKSTLAYHFINYVLSKNESFRYDKDNFQINPNSPTFKTLINKSNPNLNLIDVTPDKKFIDINQIRELISNLNKSSFNSKPRFVLIDNIELLNINSINALLKVLEEPNNNVNFILINNNKKILPTLLSRCINYNISLTNKESLVIANELLNGKLIETINNDLINYYTTPGNIVNLAKFGKLYKYDLINYDLKKLLKIIINKNHYKKDTLIKHMVFDLMEFYFRKINSTFSLNINQKYRYFLKKVSDTKNYNLDEESLFMEFDEEVLNG